MSLHALTGYGLIPFALHHIYSHRTLPLELGMSSLMSYTYVSHAIRRYPLASISLYTTATLVGVYDATAGIRILTSGGRRRRLDGWERFMLRQCSGSCLEYRGWRV
ncbi:hypothetical protein BT69DRAFT_1280001, partial [Atractiella rhizophila]